MWTLKCRLLNPQLLAAPGQFRRSGQGDAFCSSRSVSSEGSVCERTQDEETILLLPNPLQQFVDSRDRQGLGRQWTEAEVELETTCYPCQQVFRFTTAVEGAQRSGWMVQAAVKVLVQTHQPFLLLVRLVQVRILWTGVQPRAL